MTISRIFTSAAFLLTASFSFAQYTDVINSNRPGESMGAFSVGKSVLQAETGGYFASEKYAERQWEAEGWGIDLQVRYGAILEQLEFILEAQYQNDHVDRALTDLDRSGFRQLTLGAKYLVYDPHKNFERKPNLYSWRANHKFYWRDIIPAVGVYAGFNVNLNNPFVAENEETATPKFMILTQNQFGRIVFVTNLYADKIISNYMSLGYIATLTFGINQRWSAFVENQGFRSDFYEDNIIRGGAAFLIKENIQVDISAGTNFKDNPSVFVAGAGLSWRFDENYKEVYIRAPQEDEDKDRKKDKEKKKKDKKKRKDGIDPDSGEPLP